MIRKGSAASKEISRNKILDPILVMEEIKDSLEKDSDFYKIVYHRYLRNLVGICRNKECRHDKELRHYIVIHTFIIKY